MADEYPEPDTDVERVCTVSTFAVEIDDPQVATETIDVITPCSEWQTNISDAYRIVCLLLVPLMRFSYLFLESHCTAEQDTQSIARYGRIELVEDSAMKRSEAATAFLAAAEVKISESAKPCLSWGLRECLQARFTRC